MPLTPIHWRGTPSFMEIAMYIINRLLVTSVLVLLFLSPAISVSTACSESLWPPVGQTPVQLARFSSVELRGGGKIILRHGPVQRVTLLKGSLTYTEVTIADGDRLVIDKCKSKCPRGYELEVEIVAPAIAGISIADGGTIEGRGSFPQRAEISVAVRDGGAIDIRSMPVDSVTAAVDQGGAIFTKAHSALNASIHQGGVITYWGDPRVVSSVQHGGFVIKGTADAENKPLSDFGDSFAHTTPPVAPIQPVRNRFW